MENERLLASTAWFYVGDAATAGATPPCFQHIPSDLSPI
jgi:hypothetical protein